MTSYDARVERGSRSSTIGTALFALATVALALLPWWGSASTQFTLVEILYYLSLAQLWNLLAGYAGLVSVGQQGFVGVGAYATFIFAERNGIDPWISVLLAGLFVAALSVPVALFAFRLEGGYFAIATWVIAEVFRLVILQIDSMGPDGNKRSPNLVPVIEEIIPAWQDRMALGLAARATVDGTPLDGIVFGLDDDGALLLRDGAGELHRVRSGDVEVIKPTAQQELLSASC